MSSQSGTPTGTHDNAIAELVEVVAHGEVTLNGHTVPAERISTGEIAYRTTRGNVVATKAVAATFRPHTS